MLLLHCADLIFTTRIRAEAAAAGATVGVARNLDLLRTKLEGCAAEGGPALRLVIVDLDAPDAIEAVRLAAAAAGGPRVVAFVSHVRGDLAAAARDAGAGEVLARSAFVGRLPALAAEAGP